MEKRASPADRDYFRRIAIGNRALADGRIPESLDEMFDILDLIRRQHGALAVPGLAGEDDGDLDGHLRFLARQRSVLSRGTKRA